jgi:N-glycosylase/DNA lyase
MTLNKLVDQIENLKNSNISETIDKRINEFKSLNKDSNEDLFKEMCFCMLTANFSAERSIKIQDELSECFLTNSEEELAMKLKKMGHRFPNARARYISGSMNCKDELSKVIKFHDLNKIRDWIVNNVKGLGYKETSHFLRNIGFDNYAIIDFHIIDLLVNYNIINKPKSLTKKNYLKIENILRDIANKTDLSLAKLDLYLWYMETGKILK